MESPASGAELQRMLRRATVHRAYLVERRRGEAALGCGVCARGCVIPEGERGFCGNRVNVGGKLYTLAYGELLAAESRPVELKPFFHFHPGATMFTICGPSCNLRCPWCQNHELSRALPDPFAAHYAPMKEVVQEAAEAGDAGICVSFTEPLMLFEYCLGLFRESRARGMVNAIVSNGYMTYEALHMLARAGLDAISVDVKGSRTVYREHCGGDAGDEPVWGTIANALELGLHVEVVHPVVTGLNDERRSFEEICEKHLRFAGRDVPLHVTAYAPAHLYRKPPTDPGFLEWAHGAAGEAGIRYHYLGNVPAPHPGRNTWCPDCGGLLLERDGRTLVRDLTIGWQCPTCGHRLPVMNGDSPYS